MSKILIIADPAGKRQVALERGIALAQQLGAQVLVAGFVYESLGAQGITDKALKEQATKKIIAARKKELQAQVRALKTACMKVDTRVIWEKNIHQWILKQCKQRRYDAVIKTGHRSEYFMYTSTDWQLLRECRAPVMIVAEKKWRNTRPILAAVDMTSKSRAKRQLNKQVIETAKYYAEAFDCDLHVLHAIHLSPVLTELDLIDVETHALQVKESLRKTVDKLSKEHQLDPKQFRMKQGPIEKVITSEAARIRAQLVVMGTVARSGVTAALLGNTAEKVLTHLRTDVLAIKHSG